MAETRLREHCLDTLSHFYTFIQAESYVLHSGPDGKRAREGDRVPPNPIKAILKDERGITGETAIRLGTFFKTSAEFWMNLQ